MRISIIARIASLCCIPGVLGCGGGETVQGPQDQPAEPVEEETLDFSPIEGAWSGTGTDGGGNFSITASLKASSRPGRQVGGVRYWLPSAPDTDCIGSWLAAEANHPTYRVQELITEGSCPDGTVTLTLNDSGTLAYSFRPVNGESGAAFARGTLTPGR